MSWANIGESIISNIDIFLPGSGGGNVNTIQTKNSGRKCILLHRKRDVEETIQLASAIGLDIVECIYQSGKEHPRSFFGSGRLNAIAAELDVINSAHPWHGVDLVLVHTNTNSTQIVELGKILGIECWDRVRLLLNLFTNQANSVEAKTVKQLHLVALIKVVQNLVKAVWAVAWWKNAWSVVDAQNSEPT